MAAARLTTRLQSAAAAIGGALDVAKADVSRLQRMAFAQEFRGVHLDDAQLADLAAMALAVPWAPGDAEQVQALVVGAARGDDEVRVRRPMQSYMCFTAFLKQVVWSVLGDAACPALAKRDAIVSALINMRCVTPLRGNA